MAWLPAVWQAPALFHSGSTHACCPARRHTAAVAELVSQGSQLDTPLLTVGFRTPSLSPSCLGAGSTALHMAAAGGRLQVCVLILHAQQQRHPGLELRRCAAGLVEDNPWGGAGTRWRRSPAPTCPKHAGSPAGMFATDAALLLPDGWSRGPDLGSCRGLPAAGCATPAA